MRKSTEEALADMHSLAAQPAWLCTHGQFPQRAPSLSDSQRSPLAVLSAGLGRKSAACVLLLALAKRDFPVDVNVGRICARLGWIPLDSEEALEARLILKNIRLTVLCIVSESLFNHWLYVALGAELDVAFPAAGWA